MTELESGYVLGTYKVVRTLGAGGMAVVYEVEHTTLGVHYALKTFVLETGRIEFFRKRFSAEGRLLARLKHPNLVRVFDLAFDDATGLLYYVMDLVLYKDGQAHTLSDIEEGSAEEPVVARWFGELCDALAYVHSVGVVHRDIKLNNILLTPDQHVVLSDFGISKVLGEHLRTDVDVSRTMMADASSTGQLIMGTEGFIAPEVLLGQAATPAADVYSLGVVFFKLLTGVWYDPCLAPSNDDSSTTAINSVKLLGHLDYNWCEILPRMLDVDPAKRPTDLPSLAASLKVREEEAAPRPSSKRWIVAAVVAVAVVAVAALLLVFSRRGGGADDAEQIPAAEAGAPNAERPEINLDDAFATPEDLR